MNTPKPPPGYSTWIEYAIATMDTRSLNLLSLDDEGEVFEAWGRAVERSEMRDAARAELAALRTERDAAIQESHDRRMALAQEIAIGLEVRGYWRPKDASSSDLILAVFKAIDSIRARVKALVEAVEKERKARAGLYDDYTSKEARSHAVYLHARADSELDDALAAAKAEECKSEDLQL